MAINNSSGNTLLESGMFPPCRVAAISAIALAGLQAVNGVSLNAVSTGNWVRTTDAQSNAQFFNGMVVTVASQYMGTIRQSRRRMNLAGAPGCPNRFLEEMTMMNPEMTKNMSTPKLPNSKEVE
jgi:hypothetical protein